MTPFAVGVVIISVGTSLPELVTSILAVRGGTSEIVAATCWSGVPPNRRKARSWKSAQVCALDCHVSSRSPDGVRQR
jgi:hypothetical protein